MPSITFDLETVTPLFLAGADQTTAELRPPAFRGALRYWFRAVASSITTFDEVKKWENKVFGSTDAGGSVIIRVQAQKAVSSCVLKRDDNFSGLVYLFFSTYKDSKREARGCFPPGSHFKIILQTRLHRQEDLQFLQLAMGAMWMLVNLGGIGSRSNRGAGNLKLKKEPENNKSEIKFTIQAMDVNQYANKISTGIEVVKKLYASIINSHKLSLLPPVEYDILSPQTSNIYLWQSQEDEDNDYWDNLLDNFGNEYKKFRLRYNNATQDDYQEIKAWLKSGGKAHITTVKRAAFGLPIQFRFKSLPNKYVSVQATGNINRSASPLHLRVIKLSDNTVAILVIYFKTKLLPVNQKLLLKSKFVGKPVTCLVPNQDIIDKEFIPNLQNKTSVLIP